MLASDEDDRLRLIVIEECRAGSLDLEYAGPLLDCDIPLFLLA